MSDNVIRRRVVVEGRVQGVWFRVNTERLARRIELSGWVRNLPSGAVEAVFEGSPGSVEAAVLWCRHGPERAQVEHVEVVDEEPEGLTDFLVTG